MPTIVAHIEKTLMNANPVLERTRLARGEGARHMIESVEGVGEAVTGGLIARAQAAVAEGFGEAPVNLKACDLTENENHCDDFHASDESWWDDVYYWTTPTADCGDPDSGETCVTQEDWKTAWTEIRG